jgi:hypothetical protein
MFITAKKRKAQRQRSAAAARYQPIPADAGESPVASKIGPPVKPRQFLDD